MSLWVNKIVILGITMWIYNYVDHVSGYKFSDIVTLGIWQQWLLFVYMWPGCFAFCESCVVARSHCFIYAIYQVNKYTE